MDSRECRLAQRSIAEQFLYALHVYSFLGRNTHRRSTGEDRLDGLLTHSASSRHGFVLRPFVLAVRFPRNAEDCNLANDRIQSRFESDVLSQIGDDLGGVWAVEKQRENVVETAARLGDAVVDTAFVRFEVFSRYVWKFRHVRYPFRLSSGGPNPL